jgi:hypothetical protein
MPTLVHLQRKQTLAANGNFVQSKANARFEFSESEFRNAANF